MSYASVSPTLIQYILEAKATEKFTDDDLIYDFMDSAISYMKENIENETTNEFVISMDKAYRTYLMLTKAQTRGLLNCIRAEILAADRQADVVIKQITTGEEPLNLRSVPSGRYAVKHGQRDIDGNMSETAFYLIDNIRDESSKWFDWVFVSILSSDEKIRVGSQRPGQTYQGKHENLLREIVARPYEAAILFGKLIGRCSICNRTLTDPESIALGIGPICLARVGWSEFDRAALKALGYGNLLK